MSMESNGGMILLEEKGVIRKNLLHNHLYTTYPTWIHPVANQGLRSVKLDTNRMTNDMIIEVQLGDHELASGD
jgi:hypothetical protein